MSYVESGNSLSYYRTPILIHKKQLTIGLLAVLPMRVIPE